jgi:hypothetical protein
MEASGKPQLTFDHEKHGRPCWSIGDRLDGPDINPEGVARLQLMINFVLPRLTKS